ncbi:MAG: hypothetical protein AVDCRST_MAG77-6205 [uncultured Chloroflexi bacterium]|uniref:ABC transporter, substrate-binding protein (Cluster 1, maltose/g3p/polyamine/iron) n=1 Tax=uncultured Chloroflexota bacterium TaxID=166587 RepID=A0A6J4KJ27_9CHLR|nr:MAG: hypothetical protein AVDCRST_MAG77-6205 [uncultured Chloroflexota bacterium]
MTMEGVAWPDEACADSTMGCSETPAQTRRSLVAHLARGAAALAGSGLVACAGPGAAPPAAQGKGCSQPMEIYHPFADTSAVAPGLRRVFADFASSHPQCSLQPVPIAPFNTEKLIASMAGGAPPPLSMLPPTQVTTWVPQGLLEPLEPYLKRDKLAGSDFLPPVWETMSWGGGAWHLPVQVDPNFPFFWNKAVLRSAGVNADRGPQTMDELDQAAQKINRESGGQWERLAFVPWQWYGTSNALSAMGYTHGGTFFDKERKRVTYNHPQVVKGVEWMASWAQRLGGTRARADQLFAGTNISALIADGKIGFAPLVSIAVPAIKQLSPTIELGHGGLPGATAAQAGVVWTGGWHVGAIPGSKRTDDAWEFIRWIGASGEGTSAVAQQMGGLPGHAKSPGFEILSRDSSMVAHVEAIKRAKFLPHSFYHGVSVDLAPLEQALDGARTVKAALDEITEKTQVRYEQQQAEQAQKKRS